MKDYQHQHQFTDRVKGTEQVSDGRRYADFACSCGAVSTRAVHK